VKRLVDIREAAIELGVSTNTLRRWDKEGRLVPQRTLGGHRRYDLEKISQDWDKLCEAGSQLCSCVSRNE